MNLASLKSNEKNQSSPNLRFDKIVCVLRLVDHLASLPSSRETSSRPGIELPTTPFGLSIFPLSSGSLGSSQVTWRHNFHQIGNAFLIHLFTTFVIDGFLVHEDVRFNSQ
jgi:hypothetical protein